MTAALQAPPPVPPPQQQALAGATIATVLVTATSVAEAAEALQGAQALAGLAPAAVRGALAVVMSLPPDRLGAIGPATLAMIRLNTARRGQFAAMAAKRLTSDFVDARSYGLNPLAALHDGIERERRYFGQHIEAMYQRAQAGARVDGAAAAYGPLLGWYTVRDHRTSAECKEADGKNFWAATPPAIGYPGGVHPHCRCFPGRPHEGARLVPGPRVLRAVAA